MQASNAGDLNRIKTAAEPGMKLEITERDGSGQATLKQQRISGNTKYRSYSPNRRTYLLWTTKTTDALKKYINA
jgi:hypothetical protein